MGFNYIMSVFLAGIAMAVVSPGSHAHAETLRIGGTGVALGGMRILGDEYQKLHPEAEIVVLPSLGSSGGVKALLKGAIGLSVSSRELKEEEKAKGATARLLCHDAACNCDVA
jgi:phosphate transport system substrate-binding protein